MLADYLIAVRAFVDAIERVANTGHAVGLPADPHDPVAWVAATQLEDATVVAFEAGELAWS